MARLKADQETKERGDWDAMPEEQRRELENTFQNTGQHARYMNIMGIKTVNISRSIRTTINLVADIYTHFRTRHGHDILKWNLSDPSSIKYVPDW